MRFATLRDGTRDGALIVVDPTGRRFARAGDIAANLQSALDRWPEVEPKLRARADRLAHDPTAGEPLRVDELLAPLPRAYEWVDGSAYINHIVLVRKARHADPPASLETDPMVYQGGSGVLLAPTQPLELPDARWGLDFESEIALVLGDVPLGTSVSEAAGTVRLLMLANDVTYRELVPSELAKGFGFFQSKPATAFSPFAITPDELGERFREGRAFLRLVSTLNGSIVGDTETGPEMHFSFFDLIAHIARTRAFTAGTVLGSGTVSNRDPARGVSCLVERRTREIIEGGVARTPYLEVGDVIRIEAFTEDGKSPFGAIEQRVVEP
ncbi:MAG TPA: fumarylacetoacetate hydrolase family protein [Polyangiaceae bacterium]|nr:fumarylacetoacetate hydrolase family protein [Polyangiaceae bacterium]